jgi:hypothetical protein
VCGKPRSKRQAVPACKCPWGTAFEHWPKKLLNTVQAMVAGPPRER